MRKNIAFCILIAALAISFTFNYLQYTSKNQEAIHLPLLSPKPHPTPNAPQKQPRPALPPAPTLLNNLVFASTRFEETHQADGKRFGGRLHVRLSNLSGKAVIKPSDIQFSTKNIKIQSVSVLDEKLILSGDFPIQEQLEITLPKGIRLSNGQLTQDTFTFGVHFKQPKPFVRFADKGPYYPLRHTNGTLPHLPIRIQSLNVTSVHLSLWRCESKSLDISNDLVYSYNDLEKALLLQTGEKPYTLNIPPNTTGQTNLDLSQLAIKLTPGVYCLGISAVTKENPKPTPEYIFNTYRCSDTQDCTWLIVSDLGVTATVSRNTAAVSVLSLQTGVPVSGALVTLSSLKRQTIATGFTNNQGCAILRFNASYQPDHNPPHTLIVKNGNDITRLRLTQQTQAANAQAPNQGTLFQENQAYIYTERGIYRSGEKIQASVVIRHRQNGMLLASQLPFTLKLQDAQGTTVFEKQLRTNGNGFASTEISLSPVAATGTYTLKVGLGDTTWQSCTLQVGSFMPDRIKLTLTPVQDILRAKDPIAFKLGANYYFGTPVETASTRGTLFSRHATAPHWKGYAVGQEKDYQNLTTLMTLKPGNISQYSQLLIQLPSLSQLQASSAPSCLPTRTSLVFSVAEPGGQSVSATATTLVLPRQFYLGLKQLPDANKVAQVEARLLSWREKSNVPAPASTKINLTLVRKEWKYVNVQNGSSVQNEWQEVETSRQELDPILLLNGNAKIPLPSVQDGRYELTADYEGQLTTLSFYHWWGEDDATRSINPNILHVTSDKTEYGPGDTATLTFNARFAGQCIAVIGEENITQNQVFPVVAGKNTIQLTIPSQMTAGTAFVQLVLAMPYQNNYTSCFAQLKLPVNQERNRLKVHLETAATAEPEQEIPITIKAQDTQGNPQSATVQLFLVDEGILSLTQYKLPDIFGFFHGAYYCNYNCYHLYNSLFTRINENQKAGGGDAAGIARRVAKIKLQKNAILILPPMELGKEGLYRTTIKLPRHTGELRVMAVATSQSQVGSCQQSLKLSEAASILPSVPIAIAENDQFTATFALFNHRLEASQATFELDGRPFGNQPFTQTLQLPKGKSATVQFKLNATRPGSFTLPYRLTLGNRIFKGECALNVRSILPYTTRSSLKILQPGESLALPAPSQAAWQTISTRQLKLTATPALALPQAMEWLNTYPYGCLEQTASCAFPFLAADNLAKSGLLSPQAEAYTNNKRDMAVIKLLGMQRSAKGFTSWPDSNLLWSEASVYAAHFLLKSKSRLITTDQHINLVAFLKEAFREERTPVGKAYVLYVLSLSKDTTGIHEKALKLLEDTHATPLSSFLAAAALYRANYVSEATPYLLHALNEFAWKNDTELPWMLSSPTTRTGLVLTLSMEFLPRHPACIQMAMELNTRLCHDTSAWGTTRDNAWALLGLSAFCSYYAPGQSTVNLQMGHSAESLRIDNVVSRTIANDASVKLTNTGKAVLFLQESIGGIPTQLKQQENAAVQVTKEYLDADGKPTREVKHGELLTVKLTIKAKTDLPHGVLLDLLPGGFQIEDATLATREGNHLAQKSVKKLNHIQAQRQDSQEDRYLLFGEIKANRVYGVAYTLRAVTPGTYAIPPTQIEDMYEPQLQGAWNTQGTITIQ